MLSATCGNQTHEHMVSIGEDNLLPSYSEVTLHDRTKVSPRDCYDNMCESEKHDPRKKKPAITKD